jgi:5-methylcytosine-specific restriction protein A
MSAWGNGRGGRPWRGLVDAVKRRDGYTCQGCGRPTEHGECDHIIPVSQGGKDEIANLRWLCKDCHTPKTLRESGVEVRMSRMERRQQRNDHWSR